MSFPCISCLITVRNSFITHAAMQLRPYRSTGQHGPLLQSCANMQCVCKGCRHAIPVRK